MNKILLILIMGLSISLIISGCSGKNKQNTSSKLHNKKIQSSVSYTYYPNGNIKSTLIHDKIPTSIIYRKDGTKKSLDKWFHTHIEYYKNNTIKNYIRMDSKRGLWTYKFFNDKGKIYTINYKVLDNFNETITLVSRIGINGNSELIKKIKPYVQGKLNGTVLEYSQGDLSAEIPYINGAKNGIEIHYINKEIVSQIPYSKGKIQGTLKEYKTINEKSKLWVQIPYSHGEINGIVKRYTKDEVSLVIPYKKNMKDGICKVYYYEGARGDKNTLRFEVPFKENKANGIATHYFKDGKIYMTINFQNGIARNAKYNKFINENINNSQANDFAKEMLFHCNKTAAFKFNKND
jgi:antitoxin component YwqK of YwqJK toxin-antitoxin module